MTDQNTTTRSRLWDAPILRAFAPPVDAPVDQTGSATEITPWGQPGTQLRSKPGPARRGRYAPAIQGAPSTTRQAEILNTALIGLFGFTNLVGINTGLFGCSKDFVLFRGGLRLCQHFQLGGQLFKLRTHRNSLVHLT